MTFVEKYDTILGIIIASGTVYAIAIKAIQSYFRTKYYKEDNERLRKLLDELTDKL